MKSTLYFVRHGKVYNPTNVIYGRLPGFILAPEYTYQLEQTATYLQNQNIQALFSSPLERAMQSAILLNQTLQLPQIHTAEDILEIYTSYQGQSYEDIKKFNFNFYFSPNWKQGDETVDIILLRMKKFMTYISRAYPGKNIVAVTHGDPLMMIELDSQHSPITLEAINAPNYIQPGEVLAVDLENNKILQTYRAFKPTTH